MANRLYNDSTTFLSKGGAIIICDNRNGECYFFRFNHRTTMETSSKPTMSRIEMFREEVLTVVNTAVGPSTSLVMLQVQPDSKINSGERTQIINFLMICVLLIIKCRLVAI